jgi:hypothetical protein
MDLSLSIQPFEAYNQSPIKDINSIIDASCDQNRDEAESHFNSAVGITIEDCLRQFTALERLNAKIVSNLK